MPPDKVIALHGKMEENLGHIKKKTAMTSGRGEGFKDEDEAMAMAVGVIMAKSNLIVSDNIDHEITALVQTKDHRNRSIHWIHQFAMLEKVSDPCLDNTVPQKDVSDLQLVELVPDDRVQKNLVFIMAIIVKNSTSIQALSEKRDVPNSLCFMTSLMKV
ncbi:hypothetical protein ACROYT_G014576 [Oculina patagonica]